MFDNELGVSKLMGNLLAFSQGSYDSTWFENRIHDLGTVDEMSLAVTSM